MKKNTNRSSAEIYNKLVSEYSKLEHKNIKFLFDPEAIGTADRVDVQKDVADFLEQVNKREAGEPSIFEEGVPEYL